MTNIQEAVQKSLIAADDVWTLWAMITAGVAGSIYLEQSYRWAARLSGPVVALLIAMILSNTGVMPRESPVYDTISNFLVPVAVSLLLFRASLIDILKTSREAFVAVQIAILGTIVGSAVSYAVMSPFQSSSDNHLPQITGMMAASYIGGGVNFFAMKDIYNVDDALTSSLLVADNFVMAAAFVLIFWLASNAWMRKQFGSPTQEQKVPQDTQQTVEEHWPSHPVSVIDIAKSIAIAVSLATLANGVSSLIRQQVQGETPESTSILLQIISSLLASRFVWLTIFTITAATLFKKYLGRIHSTDEIGGFLLYLFLFTIGLPSDFLSVVRNVPSMFLLCTIMAAFNLGITLILGRLFHLKLDVLLLASNATLGGPPTAAAMAVSLGWKNLVTPGLLIGLWGYVVGTAIGVCITEVLIAMSK